MVLEIPAARWVSLGSRAPPPLPGHSIASLLSLRSWASWVGLVAATLQSEPKDPRSQHWPGSFSPCQLGVTVYLFGHYETGDVLSGLGVLALMSASRGSKDHPERPRARAGSPEPAPRSTHSLGDPLPRASPTTLHTRCHEVEVMVREHTVSLNTWGKNLHYLLSWFLLT